MEEVISCAVDKLRLNKASNVDVPRILGYIGDDCARCLYLYIDMRRYGIDGVNTEAWALETCPEGEIRLVALAYRNAIHLFTRRLDIDLAPHILPLILQRRPTIICAEAGLIRSLQTVLSPYGYIPEFGHVGAFKVADGTLDTALVNKATPEDIPQIADLLFSDRELTAYYSCDELIGQLQSRFADGFSRSFVIRQDGKIVAHVGTGGELDNLCTVAYVSTHPDYRHRGYARTLFAAASEELSAEGKSIFSVYYPEQSHRMHHLLGFEDVCEIGKLFLKASF